MTIVKSKNALRSFITFGQAILLYFLHIQITKTQHIARSDPAGRMIDDDLTMRGEKALN